MSPRENEDTSILVPAAEEPITDFEMVMAKIEHDGHKPYTGIENAALQNKAVKKQNHSEVEQ